MEKREWNSFSEEDKKRFLDFFLLLWKIKKELKKDKE